MHVVKYSEINLDHTKFTPLTQHVPVALDKNALSAKKRHVSYRIRASGDVRVCYHAVSTIFYAACSLRQ